MDKVLSARIDEAVIRRIGALARRLKVPKKRVIEDAVEMYAASIDEQQHVDVLEETSGTWRRDDSAGQLVAQARDAFRSSMERGTR